MTLRKLLPYSIACLLTALPVLSSCVDGGMADVSLPHEEADGSGVYVSVVVNTDGGARTRTIESPTPGEDGDDEWPGENYENRIENLYLYFFDGGEDESGIRKGINADGNTQIEAIVNFSFGEGNLHGYNNRYFTEPMEIDELQIGKTYDVLAIANVDGVKTETNFNTLGELRDAATLEAVENNLFVMSSANPIFDAEKRINSVKIEGNNSKNNPATVNIDVERLAARIDCRVNDSYQIGTAGDVVKIQQFIVVNKYFENTVNNNIEYSYWFKRVTADTDLSVNPLAFTYLGDEEPKNGLSAASNYVIGPMTLNLPTIETGNHHYDNSLYFHDAEDWAQLWRGLSTEVTSKDEDGTTYYLLDYTQENVIPAEVLENEDKRKYYCTGVVFKAQYTPAGFTEGETFYWYANKFYKTLEEIATAMGGNISLTDDTCSRYGIYKYTNGICYYTYWIRHADDGDPTKISPMEYAIVRNNIYQLDVNSVSGIGGTEPGEEGGLIIRVSLASWREDINVYPDFD